MSKYFLYLLLCFLEAIRYRIRDYTCFQILYRDTYATDQFEDITYNVTGCAGSNTNKDLGCLFDNFYSEARKLMFDANNTGISWTDACKLDNSSASALSSCGETLNYQLNFMIH